MLTDEKFFQGSFDNLAKIKAAGVSCPLLCKEFIVEAYQIFKARVSGADAVLLIAAVLPNQVRGRGVWGVWWWGQQLQACDVQLLPASRLNAGGAVQPSVAEPALRSSRAQRWLLLVLHMARLLSGLSRPVSCWAQGYLNKMAQQG